MKLGFYHAEAELLKELSSRHHLSITEELVRTSFVRGLLLSNPAEAPRIRTEAPVNWTDNPCWNVAAHSRGRGRPLQHDVVVDRLGADAGGLVEVKWLKQKKANDVLQDFWKLWLARSTVRESDAMQSFLLVGGSSDMFSDTLSAVRASGLDLRWSPAGRGEDWPDPRTFNAQGLTTKPVSQAALLSVLQRGTHYRTPPEAWAQGRLILRQRWFRTIQHGTSTVGWRLALWELTHRGVGNTTLVNWPGLKAGVTFAC